MKDLETHHLRVDCPGIDPALVESLPPPLIAYSDAHTGRCAALASALKSVNNSSFLRENPSKNTRKLSESTVILIFFVVFILVRGFDEENMKERDHLEDLSTDL
jgi:hypothetical protein